MEGSKHPASQKTEKDVDGLSLMVAGTEAHRSVHARQSRNIPEYSIQQPIEDPLWSTGTEWSPLQCQTLQPEPKQQRF